MDRVNWCLARINNEKVSSPNLKSIFSCFQAVLDVKYDTPNVPVDTSNLECPLAQPVKELVELLFDEKAMLATLAEYELDMEKMPLGKLSSQQIKSGKFGYNTRSFRLLPPIFFFGRKRKFSNGFFVTLGVWLFHLITTNRMLKAGTEFLSKSIFWIPGYQILEEIINVIKGHLETGKDDNNNVLITLSNTFYTTIPHTFGLGNPPVLGDSDLVTQKIQMLDAMAKVSSISNDMVLLNTTIVRRIYLPGRPKIFGQSVSRNAHVNSL